jgi:hypothetical protein
MSSSPLLYSSPTHTGFVAVLYSPYCSITDFLLLLSVKLVENMHAYSQERVKYFICEAQDPFLVSLVGKMYLFWCHSLKKNT